MSADKFVSKWRHSTYTLWFTRTCNKCNHDIRTCKCAFKYRDWPLRSVRDCGRRINSIPVTPTTTRTTREVLTRRKCNRSQAYCPRRIMSHAPLRRRPDRGGDKPTVFVYECVWVCVTVSVRVCEWVCLYIAIQVPYTSESNNNYYTRYRRVTRYGHTATRTVCSRCIGICVLL